MEALFDNKMWFETLTGFREKSSNQVRENITIDGDINVLVNQFPD